MIEEEDDLDEPDENVWPLSEPEDNLLYSSDTLGYRVLRLTGANSSIVCILLREEEDSFLVALPAKLEILDNGSKNMVSILPAELSTLRIFKSSIGMIMHIYEPVKEFYNTYLKEVAPKMYPDLIDELDLDCEVPEDEEDLLTEVERKVEEALLNGSFIGNPSDTFH